MDVSSLLRSGARVSPTQLSGKTIVDIISHSQGSNFFDLSFQEETIVDRSLRVLYLGKYVNYICNIVSQSVESYLQRSSSFSPLLVFCFPKRICSFGHSTKGGGVVTTREVGVFASGRGHQQASRLGQVTRVHHLACHQSQVAHSNTHKPVAFKSSPRFSFFIITIF